MKRNPYALIDRMGPREAYDTGYANGESNIEADIATTCDQLGIEHAGRPLMALGKEIERLRTEVKREADPSTAVAS